MCVCSFVDSATAQQIVRRKETSKKKIYRGPPDGLPYLSCTTAAVVCLPTLWYSTATAVRQDSGTLLSHTRAQQEQSVKQAQNTANSRAGREREKRDQIRYYPVASHDEPGREYCCCTAVLLLYHIYFTAMIRDSSSSGSRLLSQQQYNSNILWIKVKQ